MNIQQELQDLVVELRLNVTAPQEWGTDIMKEDKICGEVTRDYFALEDYVVEMIEEGNVEVVEVNDMYAGSEKEKVTLTIDL